MILGTTLGCDINGEGARPASKETAHEQPITVLSSWIDRYPDGSTYWEIKLRTNERIRGCNYATQWFDQSGTDITDDGKPLYDKSGHPLPVVIPTAPATMVFDENWITGKGDLCGQTIRLYEPSRQSHYRLNAKHIVMMKCRLISVRLANDATWTPAPHHPITFEARLKEVDEKGNAK